MSCERCGATGEIEPYKLNRKPTPDRIVNLCTQCASKDKKLLPIEGKDMDDVPKIQPATQIRDATDAFMNSGPTGILAQSPEEADGNIKEFSAVTTSVETDSEITPTAPAQPPAITSEHAPDNPLPHALDIEAQEKDLAELVKALRQKEAECTALGQAIQGKRGYIQGLKATQ
jgi:hypothetical protein